MAEKHTEAPWSYVGNSWQYTTIYAADGTPICRLDLEDWGVTEENQCELEAEQAKVAALIAQAPAMLAALKDARAMLSAVEVVDGENGDPWSNALARMNAVIAAATGEAP